MSTGLSILKVEPMEISFPKTLYQSHSSTLTFTNTSAGPVAYKVKTTAPKAYMVRPSTGVIMPGEKAEIQMVLHPLTQEPSQNDRFLVQAAVTEKSSTLSKDEWQQIPREELEEMRMKVVFSESRPSVTSGTMSVREVETSDPDIVKSRYNELVHYTLGLEKEKTKLEQENNRLKSGMGTVKSSGYSTFQLLIGMIIAVVLARALSFYGL